MCTLLFYCKGDLAKVKPSTGGKKRTLNRSLCSSNLGLAATQTGAILKEELRPNDRLAFACLGNNHFFLNL